MAEPTPGTQRWQIAMWNGAGFGLLLTILVLLTFIGASIWRATSLVEERPSADLAFTFASIGMINLLLLRLVAVLIGAAIAFAGLAVSFFAHDKPLSIDVQQGESAPSAKKLALSAYSPGLVGLLVGAGVIVAALYAKGEFNYQAASSVKVMPPTETHSVKPASSPTGFEDVPYWGDAPSKPASAGN